ncbi:MAG: VOC family protein, partial [Actinomycetota bacterium]
MGLRDFQTATMIPAKDLQGTRRFYEDKLGFSPVEDTPEAIVYKSGNSQFNLYATPSGGSAQHTLIGWLVDDIDASVDELTGNGVTFEAYDYPDFKTDPKGIAAMGD